MQQRFWFFPSISLSSYIKKYPWLFTFSLLCALAGVVNLVFHVLLYQREDIGIPGFTVLVRCFGMGIPLFALLHLLSRSRWLGRFKSGAIWHSLGLLLLLGLFIHFTDDEALDNSLEYGQLYGFLILVLFALPLFRRLKSPQKQWEYLTSLILCAASAFLVFSALGYLLNIVYINFPATFMNYFFESEGGNMEFTQSLVLYLIIPWYGMGFLEKALEPEKKSEQAGAAIGTGLAYGAIVAALICYLFDVFMILKWAFTKEPVSSDYVFFFLSSCALGFASLVLLTPLSAGKGGKWTGDYRKIVAGISLPVLAYCVILLFHDGRQWEAMGSPSNIGGLAFLNSGYPELLLSFWLFGSSLYYLFRKNASWAWPFLCLMALSAVTLAGPFSPREVDFRYHHAKLDKLLLDAGMLKEGHVQKPQASLDPEIYAKIQEELTTIATNSGISRLQPWFTFDLRPLGSIEEGQRQNENGYMVASRVMQALDVEVCNTVDYRSSERSFGPKQREYPLDIAGYSQEQQFYFRPGCPVIKPGLNDRLYVAGLTDQNRILTVQFGDHILADVPLEKLSQVMKAYDYNEIIRSRVPQKELSVEFENAKVKLKVYFQSLQAFKTGEELRVTGGSGTLLIKLK